MQAEPEAAVTCGRQEARGRLEAGRHSVILRTGRLTGGGAGAGVQEAEPEAERTLGRC